MVLARLLSAELDDEHNRTVLAEGEKRLPRQRKEWEATSGLMRLQQSGVRVSFWFESLGVSDDNSRPRLWKKCEVSCVFLWIVVAACKGLITNQLK